MDEVCTGDAINNSGDEKKNLLALTDDELRVHVEKISQKIETLEVSNVHDISAKPQHEGNLPQDVYSLLYFDNNVQQIELAFNLKVLIHVIGVFLFEILMLSFVLANLLDYRRQLPVFNPPPDVNWYVRISQYFAIPLAMWTQDDLVESIDLLWYGYQNPKHRWLLLSGILKFAVGFLGLFISFIIIIQSLNIVDLFANFAAMAFIALTDNILYNMIKNGFIVKSLRKRVENVSEISIKKVGERIKGVFILAMLFMLLCPVVYVHERQQSGAYLSKSIEIYSTEETGLIAEILRNGEYVWINGTRHNGRPIYWNKDCMNRCSKANVTYHYYCMESCYTMSYCSTTKDWAYPYCHPTNSYSDPTTNLFEVSEINEWNVFHFSPFHKLISAADSASSFSIISNRCEIKDHCGGMYSNCVNRKCQCNGLLGVRCQGPKPCKKLVVDISKQFPGYSDSFKLLYKRETDYHDEPFLLRGRPVYYAKRENQKLLDIILFIGSRWLLIHTYRLDLTVHDTVSLRNVLQEQGCFPLFQDCLTELPVSGYYISQETYGFSPAGLSWSEWIHWNSENENREDGLFGKVESVESFLLCEECGYEEYNEEFDEGSVTRYSCNDSGYCYDPNQPCVCDDGWFGIRCQIPSVGQVRVQVTLEYEGSLNCVETSSFDSLPFGGNENEEFSIDLIPPLMFGEKDSNNSTVGIYMTKNLTQVNLYQSSCEDSKKSMLLLKQIKLPPQNNLNSRDYTIQKHEELFEITSAGVQGLTPLKHEYCEDTLVSSSISEYFMNEAFQEKREECSDYFLDQEKDPTLMKKNLIRLLVTIKFDTVSLNPIEM